MKALPTLLLLLVLLPGVVPATHSSSDHGEAAGEGHDAFEPRYARPAAELHEEYLTFGEKSHGALSQGWVISEYHVLSGEDAAGLQLLEGTGKRTVVESSLLYGEKVIYRVHGKALEVTILEFPDVETAQEVYGGIFRKLGVLGFIPSNEFGYEGYAATVDSQEPETNGYRRGQFIVHVQGKEGASAYDVKMMCKVIDNDLKAFAQEEGTVLEMDPFLRVDSRGIVIGSRLFEKKLIGLVAIGVNFAFISLVAMAVGLTWMWRRRRRRLPKAKEEEVVRTPLPPRSERIKEFLAPLKRPPKEVKVVLGIISILGFLLMVLVIDVVVQFILTWGMTEHRPGSTMEMFYEALGNFVDISMTGVTLKGTGYFLSKNVLVLIFSLMALLGGLGAVLTVALVLLVKRGRGLSLPTRRRAGQGPQERLGIVKKIKEKLRRR
jgi:hypothetical protein